MIIRYTETALDEIDELLSFIARDNPVAAVSIAAAIRQAIDSIAEQPESAPIVNGRDLRAKLLVRYPFRIFYIVRGGELVVRNVRSTRRQLPAKRSTT